MNTGFSPMRNASSRRTPKSPHPVCQRKPASPSRAIVAAALRASPICPLAGLRVQRLRCTALPCSRSLLDHSQTAHCPTPQRTIYRPLPLFSGVTARPAPSVIISQFSPCTQISSGFLIVALESASTITSTSPPSLSRAFLPSSSVTTFSMRISL